MPRFGRSFPFSLLQSNNATTLCSTGSQQGLDVADTVNNAVDCCCANVERAERELFQPVPRPGALNFVRAAFLSVRVPRHFFRASALRLSLNCKCFLPNLPSSDVLGAALPTRPDFSIVDTFTYYREHPSSPPFETYAFRSCAVPTLLPQVRLPRETNSLC